MVAGCSTSSLCFPLPSLWFEIQTKTDTEVTQTLVTQFSSLVPLLTAWKSSHGRIMVMRELSWVSQRILLMYSLRFPMVRLGLLLFAIFSLEKEKGGVGGGGERLGQQLKKSGKEKGFSAKTEASSEWKEERRATVRTQPVTWWMLADTHLSSWLGLCITEGGESSEWGGHPVICSHFGAGKGLSNDLFLKCSPLGTGQWSGQLWPPSFYLFPIHSCIWMWRHWFECSLLLTGLGPVTVQLVLSGSSMALLSFGNSDKTFSVIPIGQTSFDLQAYLMLSELKTISPQFCRESLSRCSNLRTKRYLRGHFSFCIPQCQ